MNNALYGSPKLSDNCCLGRHLIFYSIFFNFVGRPCGKPQPFEEISRHSVCLASLHTAALAERKFQILTKQWRNWAVKVYSSILCLSEPRVLHATTRCNNTHTDMERGYIDVRAVNYRYRRHYALLCFAASSYGFLRYYLRQRTPHTLAMHPRKDHHRHSALRPRLFFRKATDVDVERDHRKNTWHAKINFNGGCMSMGTDIGYSCHWNVD